MLHTKGNSVGGLPLFNAVVSCDSKPVRVLQKIKLPKNQGLMVQDQERSTLPLHLNKNNVELYRCDHLINKIYRDSTHNPKVVSPIIHSCAMVFI